jgi:predicted dehydrogenase
MYRHHPQTTLARKLVADGAIGRLAYVRAALSVSAPPGDIRRSVALGGGALGDLGCYCVSAIRLFAGEPTRVHASQVRDGPAGVDLRLAATLRLPGDVLAQFDVALDLTRRDELELVGTEARLTIPDPFIPKRTMRPAFRTTSSAFGSWEPTASMMTSAPSPAVASRVDAARSSWRGSTTRSAPMVVASCRRSSVGSTVITWQPASLSNAV